MKRLVWWHVAAVILTLLAAAMPPFARELAGPHGALVHVRWRAGIEATTRQQLEVRHRLLDGAPLTGST